jgi:hypothetical protein
VFKFLAGHGKTGERKNCITKILCMTLKDEVNNFPSHNLTTNVEAVSQKV